jgi:hypothetical protein
LILSTHSPFPTPFGMQDVSNPVRLTALPLHLQPLWSAAHKPCLRAVLIALILGYFLNVLKTDSHEHSNVRKILVLRLRHFFPSLIVKFFILRLNP